MQADKDYVCRETWSRDLEIRNQFQTAGLMISCIFLSLTILLHLAIPTLRDMQNLCLLCHIFSLLVADAVLFTNQLCRGNMSFEHCVANAFILQYSYLATFFWLNVMCFDVWHIIKSTVKMVRVTGITSNGKKKFLLYCAYAWGVPLVIGIVTAVMQFLPDHLLFDKAIRPGFGEVNCWFKGDYAHLSYFYGFAGFLFFVNLLFLGHTIVMMIQAGSTSRDTTFTVFNRNHLDEFWQRFSLFCLMALCWLINFLAVLLSSTILSCEIWIPILQCFTSFQGFIVFVIFTSNKKKREVILNLWKNRKSSLVQVERKISRMETTRIIWHVADDQVTTNDIAPKVEGSIQQSSRARKPSEGIANQGFEGTDQKTSGE